MFRKFIGLLVYIIFFSDAFTCSVENLKVISIATKTNDGFERFERSLKAYNYNYEILGMGEEWRGGDIKKGAGGGQKINILKKSLEKYKDDENLIVVLVDSYDVIATQEPKKLLEKFKNSGARVIMSAESVCWPNPNIAEKFPEVGENEKRFPNSGGIIGYVTDLYEIINLKEIKDDDDDQYYYQLVFLNVPSRNKYKMKLDTRSDIFQNLNGAFDELSLVEIDDNIVVYNNITESYPAFFHGNGPSKTELNRMGNYIGKAYTTSGCKICLDDKIELKSDEIDNWPNVTMAIFIESPTPFLREFFRKVSNLNYPKSKITLLVHNNVDYHNEVVEDFFVHPDHEYLEIKYISPEDEYTESEARTEAIYECIQKKCDFYFTLCPTQHLDNPDTLKILIEQNRGVLAPVLLKTGTMWSNVWGSISVDGFYKRSVDYFDIINRNILGVWNLPFVGGAVLTKGELLKEIGDINEDKSYDPSMVFAQILRDKNIFMYGTNIEYFGHIISTDTFNTSLIRPEMYEIASNFQDWVDRYIHKDYQNFLNNVTNVIEPCPDVFWFPVVTDEFCGDLIVMMEDFGEWSGGRNNYEDHRLPGGVENVPTVDIHMRQIDWDKHWLFFLKKIIMPMQQIIFPGYWSNPPQALLSFVVKYKPGEQDYLKPHNDASTYTLNIALNKPDVDFEGGGCRFIRRNCNVTKTRKGWAMMHPGRLTHLHEGLRVTKGTRYIMVTFVDP